MTYKFSIEIRPCVNFSTHAAKISVIDHTYQDGGEGGKGIVVHQKHIQTCPDNDLAEQVAEEYCSKMHELLKGTCQKYLQSLPAAKP